MKTHLFLKFFFPAFTFLLMLQGAWLYYAYQRSKIEIENSLNTILLNSTEQEMAHRLAMLEDLKMTETQHVEILNPDFFEVEIDYSGSMLFQQYNFMQQILISENIYFNLPTLDSIFSAYLTNEKLHLNFQLLYTDSLDNIVESTEVQLIEGFRTESIPIVNGYKIQSIVKITSPVVFKKMLVILLVSVCMFILIITCIIYLINVFLSQHYLNQLRENFTQALTHDMKTPLGTIFTVLDRMKKGALDDNPEMKNQFIQIGIEQTQSLQAIVNQILTVAYIDKKQLNLNKELVDLPQIFKPLIDKFTIKGGKEIVFSEEYQLNNTPIFVDRLYLSNAISNLIDNAIKYSGDSVKININCIASDEQICIRIIDNGFGISVNDRQKIFERFERGAEIKRNKISGFGLGLNYVKAIIEAHEGHINVHSQPGKGSEFVITIPVSDN